MISNIQVLRAFAALAVVFYHTGYFIDGRVHTDFQGVAVFFVISGFIMVYTTSRLNSELVFQNISTFIKKMLPNLKYKITFCHAWSQGIFLNLLRYSM